MQFCDRDRSGACVCDPVRDLRPGEVARLVDVQLSTVIRWCQMGRLRAYKIGDRWRIPRQAVAEFTRGRVVV